MKMKKVFKFLGGLFLFVLAYVLFLPLSLLNFVILLFKVKEFGWYQKEITLHLGSSKTKGKKRVEVLTANYPI